MGRRTGASGCTPLTGQHHRCQASSLWPAPNCTRGPVDVLSTAVPAAAARCPCLQALQEPLGVALGVLDEVEAFRQALVAQDVARVS